jgi:hypothetical protein
MVMLPKSFHLLFWEQLTGVSLVGLEYVQQMKLICLDCDVPALPHDYGRIPPRLTVCNGVELSIKFVCQ